MNNYLKVLYLVLLKDGGRVVSVESDNNEYTIILECPVVRITEPKHSYAPFLVKLRPRE